MESLKNDLRLQTTTLLASDTTRSLLQRRTKKSAGGVDASLRSELLAQADKHTAHKQQCLYRACASVTALRIRDPDPNAVDGGNILGLRFEVMSRSRFNRPYYVMLNRPYPGSQHLRVHRHTVPPCIPLAGLAARHLPAPKSSARAEKPREQDIPRFAHALRRELVRYHNRLATIGDLRKAAGLGGTRDKERQTDVAISDISASDAQAKQVGLEWEDGRTGRLVMDDDGKILKVVAQGENGRDRQAVRELLGDSVRIEELVHRLEGT